MLMKLNPSFFTFFNMIFLSVVIVLSSSNWFTLWLGLELSLLGFLPLFNYISSTDVSGMIKYFLIQASGSMMFFWGVVAQMPLMFIFGFVMKLGLFPFFMWVPSVMVTMSWAGCYIISSIQKLPALLGLFNCMSFSNNFNSVIWGVSVISVLLSSLLGLNQSNLRNLMAYSSISHTSYLLLSLFLSFKLFFFYLSVYFIMSGLIFYLFNVMKLSKISDLQNSESFNINILIISLMGMPPFPIFVMKVLVISFFVFKLGVLGSMIGMILMLGSGLSAFYYLYVILSSSINSINMISSKKYLIMLLSMTLMCFAIILS